MYDIIDEPNDCLGLAGITVEITDADGTVLSTTTNEAGNFYIDRSKGPIAFPYRAKVISDAGELQMATPQSEGSCASCHTPTGENAAAGRLIAP